MSERQRVNHDRSRQSARNERRAVMSDTPPRQPIQHQPAPGPTSRRDRCRQRRLPATHRRDRQAQPDQDGAHAGGADRRHPAADHLPAAVHLHLRRRHRRLVRRLPAVPAARPARPVDRPGRRVTGPESELRHREGRLRPVPLAADRPLGAAGRGCHRRHRPVPDPLRRHPRLRHDHGLPDRDQLRWPPPPVSASRSPSHCVSAGSRSSSG